MIERDLIKIFIEEIQSRSPKKSYGTNKTITRSIDDTWSSYFLDMNDCGPQKTIEVIDMF